MPGPDAPSFDIRLCKDCRHISPVRWWSPIYWLIDRQFRKCWHPLISPEILVTGKASGFSGHSCSVERAYQPCGIQGKLWEPRP